MKNEPVIHRKGLDWITLALYLSLVIIGWLMQYAVLYEEGSAINIPDLGSPMGKTTIITLVALILFFVGYVIESKFWHTFAYPIYGFFILMLIAVLIFGTSIKGAKSWFLFLGFSFQPSEFAKFATAIAVASYISFYKQQLEKVKVIGRGFLIILLPMLLVLLQPDLGSAIVFLALIITFYRNGISIYYLVIPTGLLITFILAFIYGVEMVSFFVLLAAILFLAFIYYRNRYLIFGALVFVAGMLFLFFSNYSGIATLVSGIIFIGLTLFYWFRNQKNSSLFVLPTVLTLILFSFLTNFVFNHVLKPHQQDRISIWLTPEKSDPRGALYNVIQSKMAIGSGGVRGKGYLKGTMTNLDYVPEQSTDFIFSTVGEEQGFIGSVSIIILYTLLILRIILIGERSSNKFILSYSYALGGLFFMHFFINIGMTMGLAPVVGIPLPLLSKGGSSLMAFSLMLGILLKLDISRRIR